MTIPADSVMLDFFSVEGRRLENTLFLYHTVMLGLWMETAKSSPETLCQEKVLFQNDDSPEKH